MGFFWSGPRASVERIFKRSARYWFTSYMGNVLWGPPGYRKYRVPRDTQWVRDREELNRRVRATAADSPPILLRATEYRCPGILTPIPLGLVGTAVYRVPVVRTAVTTSTGGLRKSTPQWSKGKWTT